VRPENSPELHKVKIPPNLSIKHLKALIKKGFRYTGESEDRVLYVSMAVVDKIGYGVVVLHEG
jgi:hypothetical protein